MKHVHAEPIGRFVARVEDGASGYRDFRTTALPEAEARSILAALEAAQARGQLVVTGVDPTGLSEPGMIRTADGGWLYYRARASGASDWITEVVAYRSPREEWLYEAAARLDAIARADRPGVGMGWVPLGEELATDQVLVRIWLRGQGCGHFTHGPLDGATTHEIMKLFSAGHDFDAGGVRVHRLEDPEARLFVLEIAGPDPNHPTRDVPEIFAILTRNKNAWPARVGDRLRDLQASLPRDLDRLQRQDWRFANPVEKRRPSGFAWLLLRLGAIWDRH